MPFILLVVLPLIVGFSIYLLFDGCAVWPWLDPWASNLALCRDIPRIHELTSWDLTWLRFYLPDALWAFSFAACFVFVAQSDRSSRSDQWLMYAVAISPELGQFADVLPGTADISDLVVILVGCWLGRLCMERGVR